MARHSKSNTKSNTKSKTPKSKSKSKGGKGSKGKGGPQKTRMTNKRIKEMGMAKFGTRKQVGEGLALIVQTPFGKGRLMKKDLKQKADGTWVSRNRSKAGKDRYRGNKKLQKLLEEGREERARRLGYGKGKKAGKKSPKKGKGKGKKAKKIQDDDE